MTLGGFAKSSPGDTHRRRATNKSISQIAQTPTSRVSVPWAGVGRGGRRRGFECAAPGTSGRQCCLSVVVSIARVSPVQKHRSLFAAGFTRGRRLVAFCTCSHSNKTRQASFRFVTKLYIRLEVDPSCRRSDAQETVPPFQRSVKNSTNASENSAVSTQPVSVGRRTARAACGRHNKILSNEPGTGREQRDLTTWRDPPLYGQLLQLPRQLRLPGYFLQLLLVHLLPSRLVRLQLGDIFQFLQTMA